MAHFVRQSDNLTHHYCSLASEASHYKILIIKIFYRNSFQIYENRLRVSVKIPAGLTYRSANDVILYNRRFRVKTIDYSNIVWK